jgi:hypothetical protein
MKNQRQMENKTRYRVVSNGYLYFLEYAAPKLRFNWFGLRFETVYCWKRVPKAKWDWLDEIWRIDLGHEDWDKWINSRTENFDHFINKYPDIDVYLSEYRAEQNRLVQVERDRVRERERMKKFVKNL